MGRNQEIAKEHKAFRRTVRCQRSHATSQGGGADVVQHSPRPTTPAPPSLPLFCGPRSPSLLCTGARPPLLPGPSASWRFPALISVHVADYQNK